MIEKVICPQLSIDIHKKKKIKFFVHTICLKVAGQTPEVSTGIEIETRRNPSKPAIETRRNPSKPIETCQNRKVSTFAKMGLGFCPATLNLSMSVCFIYINIP